MLANDTGQKLHIVWATIHKQPSAEILLRCTQPVYNVLVQGYVANFVESEQVVVLEDKQGNLTTSSFVQIRGSIPLLWSQIPNIKYKPPTRIAPPSASHPAFDHHFKQLLDTYQVLCLCLCVCQQTCLTACSVSLPYYRGYNPCKAQSKFAGHVFTR